MQALTLTLTLTPPSSRRCQARPSEASPSRSDSSLAGELTTPSLR